CNLWNENIALFNNLYTIDNFGTFFKAVFLIISILVTIVSLRYIEREEIKLAEYYSLLLLGVLGMMIMTSSTNFITIFIGLEVMSIAIYVLCGLLRENAKSVEAALKYFLLGAFATAFLLYGMALVYGTTGVLDIKEIKNYVSSGSFYVTPMFVAGLAFLIVGFGFKTASVPFHMWTPDVYEGAPTSITAYMATGVKAAAFGAFLRVFYTALTPFIEGWSGILWIIAVLTMSVGNITALVQDNIKRMLAYSSIAHTGYLIIALAAASRETVDGISSMIFYLFGYTLMNIGAFAIVILISNEKTTEDKIENFAGLGRTSPFYAFIMAVFMMSLAGLPPTVGFSGKMYIFMATVKARFTWLAVIGVLNSAISVYYYAKVVIKMYFCPPNEETKEPSHSSLLIWTIFISFSLVLFFGLYPEPLLNFIKSGVRKTF
ncbi:NADH-quinone oxidoreductase subunit N, partial [Candidatus Desantisbacteria bacterium]|nr:NADH-quinone oxidoreductase subunit N [Candidatus Desantisbacteria bacterium]